MSALYIKTPPNINGIISGAMSSKNLLINLNEVKSIYTLTPNKNVVKFKISDNHTIEVYFPTPEEALEWFEKISNLVNTEI